MAKPSTSAARSRSTGRSGPKVLAPELKALVHVVEATLGQVVAQAEGEAFFDVVEAVRLEMVAVRTGGPRKQQAALDAAARRLDELTQPQRAKLARAYTIYLELVNVCENAYRTHRLRSRYRNRDAAPEARANLVYVFTAHPTESRSPTNIRLMHRAQALLVDALERGEQPDLDELRHLLHLVWRTGTHPPDKPSVADEASHLFSLLTDPILRELLALRREGHLVRLRTWVGGDKDGHPGVGPEETSASFDRSRARLLAFVREQLLPPLVEDVALIPDEALRAGLEGLTTCLGALDHVGIGDGRRVVRLAEATEALAKAYAARRGTAHPSLADLAALLDLFEGLVVPVELREEKGNFGPGSTIAHMMRFVGDVARGGQVDWYVRGCVVSMTEAPEDLLEAEAAVRRELGGPALPVIPLFELPDVLRRATQILDGALEDANFRASIAAHHGSLEVMLGYSDTSKRMGVLASRLAINATMNGIGAWGAERGIRTFFFHGSGGSVGRGGGTVEDQASTWPPGACALIKQTLQGEMVERTLATPEILRSQVEKVASVQASPPATQGVSDVARELAEIAEATFVEVAGDPTFTDLLARATPYTRLGVLTIGSRPSSRGNAPKGLEGLRAIPWVLCWTQTRYLLHAWLGTGAAWRKLRKTAGGEARLRKALKRDPLLRSYLRMLGFTLAKTAPRIWSAYVRELGGDDPAIVKRLEREYRDALALAEAASDGGQLLSERPWLAESIYYRAPMIHPLNLLQIQVLGRKRPSQAQLSLFRETVTGIAAGMLTTG
jgi:phosphoenolpyruvate carboxylase